MATTVYDITNTEGTSVLHLPSTSENTSLCSLRLYGQGHIQWGEGVNENFYRLLEHHACPEKLLSPGNPQDASDLGAGNGINNPIDGQLWWNTTQKKMFVYDTSTFSWLQMELGSGQYVLKSGDIMTGFLTLNASPTSNLHAATKQYVDGFLPLTGGTLSNFLTLHANPSSPMHAATKQYVDNTVASSPLPGLLFVPANFATFSNNTVILHNLTEPNAGTINDNTSDYTSSTQTVALPSVPVGAVSVLVRIRYNVNAGGNTAQRLYVRKNASESWVEKMVLDPNGGFQSRDDVNDFTATGTSSPISTNPANGPGIHAHDYIHVHTINLPSVAFEAEYSSTFNIFFDTTSNNFQYYIRSSRSGHVDPNDVGDPDNINVQVVLEGYFTQISV